MIIIAIPKLPKPSLVRLYYQSYAATATTTAATGSLQSKGSQAKPGASKPARDFTFGIQEALGISKSQILYISKSQNL